MPTPNRIESQINNLVGRLVEIGLSDDQCYAFQRSTSDNLVEITFENSGIVSLAMKEDKSYDEIYQGFVQGRAYNLKMLDGALIQMMYTFESSTLQSHRLAFFPAPHLEEFQNNPEIYLEDEIYADVVAKNIVSFPVRFDYDARESVHQELSHPKSHLTLGQYENCRIPVTAPLTPWRFLDFILRNFYNTAFERYSEKLQPDSDSFAPSISSAEMQVVHVVVPT